MSESRLVFVSSSLDLREARPRLKERLENEFVEFDWGDLLSTYLWESETQDGDLLNDRFPPQRLLEDPANERTILTLCLFGERCGVPLEHHLPEEMAARAADWVAKPDEPGVLHPWPQDKAAQQAALSAGCYPLTGTTYELISADQHPDGDTLVLGYVADIDIREAECFGDITFNERKYRYWLESERLSDNEVRELREPQVHALFNLLKHLVSRGYQPRRYDTEVEMARHAADRALERLKTKLKSASKGNPFKSGLGHYSLDETRRLPGRGQLVRKCAARVRAGRSSPECCFVMVKGPSGCGKSSVLQSGILHELRKDGDIVLPIRPTDLPLEFGDTATRLDLLWRKLEAEIPGLRDAAIEKHPNRERASTMANKLIETLEAQSKNLVIGLDQFEEMIDEMHEFRDRSDKPEGWWQVLQFLGFALKSPTVGLITTLESLREERFHELGIARHLGAEQITFDAEVSAETLVEEIAAPAFANAGLKLADDLKEAIKTYWDKFREGQKDQGITSSPLPLAGLWLERLYNRFDHLADTTANEDALFSALNRAARENQNEIRLADLPNGVSFSRLIENLAEDAWDLGGGDRDDDKAPDALSLTNFLSGLVGKDGGRMQLLAMPVRTGIPQTDRLISSFLQKRLLVYTSDDLQYVRLTHQAVIDQWPPARKWAESRESYFKAENRFRKTSDLWEDDGWPEDVIAAFATPQRIQEAAQILAVYRVAWPGRSDDELPHEDVLLRRAAISVLNHAEDGATIVNIEQAESRYFHVAIQHGILPLMRRFLKEDPSFKDLRGASDRLPIAIASWTDNGAVDVLLEHGASLPDAKEGEHPLLIAVWADAIENVKSLLAHVGSRDGSFRDGYTMLHWAVSGGAKTVFDHLLSLGARTDEQAEDGRLPIHIAAHRGEAEMYKRLFSVETMLSQWEGFTPFHLAATAGHAEILAFTENHPEVTDEHLGTLYAGKNNTVTPLTGAAFNKRPEVLKFLLTSKHCDLSLPAHTGTKLFELVMTPEDPVRDDQRIRARRCVEVLLEDGRFDGSKANEAFRLGEQFPEARDVLRRVLPTQYDEMDAATRESDLRSRRDSIVLKLLRDAPQALTDGHPNKTGLEILIEDDRFEVLSICLVEDMIPEAKREAALPRLLMSSSKTKADALRVALLEHARAYTSLDFRPILLDSALRHDQADLIERLCAEGCNTIYGSQPIAASVFHDAAARADIARFRELAARASILCPVDAWGRYPSDVAPDARRDEIAKLESELFTGREINVPRALVLPQIRDTKPEEPEKSTAIKGDPKVFDPADGNAFDLARKGNEAGFENELAGLQRLPRDSWGRRPSDHAPDRVSARIREIEDRYFDEEGNRR